MMYSAIVIALIVALTTRVWAHAVPTTIPPAATPYNTPPSYVCHVNGTDLAFGETYEIKYPENGTCLFYSCDNPPNANSEFGCYDNTNYGECCRLYMYSSFDYYQCVPSTDTSDNGRPVWGIGTHLDKSFTEGPLGTQPTQPPYPGDCYVNGVTIAYGETYEDIENDICRYYSCHNPPNASSVFKCYDSATDTCVEFRNVYRSGRVCVTHSGWFYIGCGPMSDNVYIFD